MVSTVSVRHAKANDLPFIIEELKSFSVFFNSKIPLFQDERHAVNVMLTHINEHLLLVAEDARGLLGFIGGMYHPHTFNPNIHVLTETFWWCAEKFRQSRAGLVLLNEFTRIGKTKADWIVFTLEQDSRVNEKHLHKRGYLNKERTYILEVER